MSNNITNLSNVNTAGNESSLPWDIIYVINMDSDHDRLVHITNELKQHELTFERIEGVNGKDLTKTDLKRNTTFFCRNFCTSGLIGCAISHIKAYKRFLESDHNVALILEDDATFPMVFHNGRFFSIENINEMVCNLPVEFDILLIGHGEGSQRSRHTLTTLYAKLIGFHTRDVVVDKHLYTPDFFCGSHCYMVTRRGAEKLIKELDGCVNWHHDIMVAKLIHKKKLNGYAIYPSLAGQRREDLGSHISTSKFPWLLNYIVHNKRVELDMNSPVMQVMGVHLNAWTLVLSISGLIISCIVRKSWVNYAYTILTIPDLINAIIAADCMMLWQTLKSVGVHYFIFTQPYRVMAWLL